MRRSLQPLLSAIAVGVAFMAAGAAWSAEPVKIRLAFIAPPSDMQPMPADRTDILVHMGKSYTLDATHFASTPQILTAVADGEVDIGMFSFSSLALAVTNAKMDDLRVIYDGFQDGVAGYHSTEFMVRKDSPIRTIDDLKGKILATLAPGSAMDMAIRQMMREHKMEDKKDYTIIEVGFANMKSVLADKKVDLVSVGLPFGADPSLREMARTLFTQKEAIGQTQMIVWGARTGFLQQNRAAMVDFLEDALRMRRFDLDPAHHQEAVDIITKSTKLPASLFESWVFTKNDYYYDPHGLPNLDVLQANINLLGKLGFVKGDVDVKKYADLSIVKEADRRLQ